MWVGADVPLPTSAYLRLTTSYTPKESGSVLFGYASVQPTEVKIGGEVFLQDSLYRETDDPFLGLMDPPCSSKNLDLVAGESIDIEINVDLAGRIGLGVASQSFTFGIETDRSRGSAYIAEAVEHAKSADLAIVVVGTNSKVESEGFDRKNLDLPGRQDELVESVVAANPNTIVIVNSGSPVLMPWRDKVKAILVTYFAGQEMGNGLVDILTGATEPGGRLPTTWPKTLDDVPVLSCTAQDPGNHVTYDEGIHVGYRAWLKAETDPAYEFGFGLGYTTWEISQLEAPGEIESGVDFEINVAVENTGARFGKQIVQIYAAKTDSIVDRPVRWLVGFAEVHANAGELKTVNIRIKSRELANWDNGWKFEAGQYQLSAGTSVSKLSAQTQIEII
jgi:beta-glucosidase